MISDLSIIRERLSSIKSMLAKLEGGATDGLGLRINRVLNIVLESEGKIWLRTRFGRLALTELSTALDKALRSLEEGGITEEFEVALYEVENKANSIEEESRRRSMVVT